MNWRFTFYSLCSVVLLNEYSFAQDQFPEVWTGKIQEGKNMYEYTLNITQRINDSVFGTSISKTQGFYCETAFRGSFNKTSYRLLETRVLRMNYKGTDVCLMDLRLKIDNKKMTGSFESSSVQKKECGSGTVVLNRLEPVAKKEVKKDKPSIAAAMPTSPAIIERESRTEQRAVPINQGTLLAKRELEKREQLVIDRLKLAEDSATIRIYDNGVIDDDFISLVVNDRIIFDRVKLEETPLTYTLKRKEGERYTISFHAETLGSIPPNTGLIVITAGQNRKELLFTSDLQKTSALLIELIGKNP